MKKTLNDEVIEIWKNYNKNDLPAPLFYPDYTNVECELLSIGMNPSFKKEWFRKQGLGALSSFSEFMSLTESERNKLIKQDAEITDAHKSGHFARHKEIADSLCGEKEWWTKDWKHVDLFFCRGTDQKIVEKYIYDKDSKLSDFGRDQLNLSWKLAANLKPRILLVTSGQASKTLRNEFHQVISWDDLKGYHFIKMGNEQIPVFFSSTLSGGHLDNGSFERLKWHMKRAYRKK